jgi:16S rRNA G966 N2-methylase RsmD
VVLRPEADHDLEFCQAQAERQPSDLSKPLDLLGYPIGNSTQENAIVIDTFGGSGSTLMACEQMNRTCCTMELDEKYASVILRRYVDDTGDADGVYVIRNGEKIPYSNLVKEVEQKNESK